MDYWDIKTTMDLVNRAKLSIERDKKLLINDPDDLASKVNLFELKEFYSNVLNNLNVSLFQQNMVAFNLYIFNSNEDIIDISNFDEIFNPIQKGIDLCDIHFENIGRNEDNSSLEVISVAPGSLNVTVASKYKKDSENFSLRNALELFNEIIDCEDDIDKLKKIKDKVGLNPIIEYWNLLNVLNDKKLNLKLYDEKPLGFNTRVIDDSLINKVLPVLNNFLN